jgi:hypothetical protein
MKPGDLIIFAWPDQLSKVDDPLDWEKARIGLLVEVTSRRPGDEKYGDEWLVLHNNERWSVPSKWCRPIKENE